MHLECDPTCVNMVTHPRLCHREAWGVEASLVRGGACSSGDSSEEKPHGAACPRKGGL